MNEAIKQDAIEFVQLVEDMRKAQQMYFKGHKHKTHLERCKELERSCDNKAKELKAALMYGKQQDLF